jgi:hypothetical protein
MKAYTVHAPPTDPQNEERFVFVKDGVSWPALFVPALWMLWHRMWLALLWYVAWVLALAWIGRLAGEDAATIVALLGAILLALEANNLRRGSLWSRGWREIGAAYGGDREEAEVRFFQSRALTATASVAAPAALASPLQPQATIVRAAYPARRLPDPDETVIGLFPEPER